MLWIVLSGAATFTFFGVLSLLAMRAAAATNALSVGATLLVGAFASHALGLWGLGILSQWFERHQPIPSVPLFLAVYLLVTVIIYVPIALIACGTAGIIGGLGRGTPAATTPPPASAPDEPPAPYVPPTPVPTSPPAQPSPADSYHGEEPTPPPAPAPATPAPTAVPSTSTNSQPGADDTAEEVPAPSETDRG